MGNRDGHASNCECQRPKKQQKKRIARIILSIVTFKKIFVSPKCTNGDSTDVWTLTMHRTRHDSTIFTDVVVKKIPTNLAKSVEHDKLL